MAHVLFSAHRNYYGFMDDLDQERWAGKRRLSIFLIMGACASVAALLWFGRVLWRHRKSGGRISVLMITLILSDLLELFLDPYIVLKLLQDDTCWNTSTTCQTLVSLWSAVRHYGLQLNIVVALESVLSIRHPYCSAHVFFPSCSIILSIIVFICIFVSEFCGFLYVPVLNLSLILALTVMACILTCRTPPDSDETSYRTRKPTYAVLGFVMFIVVLYMVYIVLYLFLFNLWEIHVISNCLMSLRVVSDPFLCMLVYWENLSQTPQTHTGHNTAIEMIPSQNPNDPKTHSSVI